MSGRRRRKTDDNLAQAMATLGSTVRLGILRELREPKILKEIEVQPARDDDLSPDRILSRQAVKGHLEDLLDLGVVVSRQTKREFGTTVEYLLNHQMIYALSEEFRGLASLRPVEEPEVATLEESRIAEGYQVEGPCLVLVKGLDDGQVFDLDPAQARDGSWTLGRHRGSEIPLDYDPYVSTEHAAIRYDDGRYLVEDLPESRNGTWLNYRRLPERTPHSLESGDVIGVGRSLLVFRG